MLRIKGCEFFNQSDPGNTWVEEWTAWLPFMNWTPMDSRYRSCLRGAIKNLAPADDAMGDAQII